MYSYHMGSVWCDSHSTLKDVVLNDSSDTLFRYDRKVPRGVAQ